MQKKHDIIVIGAGSGGLNVASFMNKAGFKVLLIDKDDRSIGGDCLNHGCIPSKALIHVSKIIASSRKAKEFGLRTLGKVNIKKVMDYIRSKQDIIREHENAAFFKKQGMAVELGKARFTGKNAVAINGREHTAKKIVIATGSSPRIPDIKGLDKIDYLTNESLFDLKKLPKRLLVIGAGPIGIELGQAMLNLGSKVTVVQRGSQFLPKESPEVVHVLKRHLTDSGMEFLFESNPISCRKGKILIEKPNCKSCEIRFDKVLISTGRVPNIDGLDLTNAGIDVKDGRIVVDEYLRTTNPDVYLCGDVAGQYQFTHAAEMHAKLIIGNFFTPFKKKIDYSDMAWVTYTTPEIATFGITGPELKSYEYEKFETNFGEDDRAIVESTTDGKIILYISKNRLLGGTIVANRAGEIVQELILARSAKLNVKELFNKTYPYPTASRINKRIISKLYQRKLTPFSKKVLRWLY